MPTSVMPMMLPAASNRTDPRGSPHHRRPAEACRPRGRARRHRRRRRRRQDDVVDRDAHRGSLHPCGSQRGDDGGRFSAGVDDDDQPAARSEATTQQAHPAGNCVVDNLAGRLCPEHDRVAGPLRERIHAHPIAAAFRSHLPSGAGLAGLRVSEGTAPPRAPISRPLSAFPGDWRSNRRISIPGKATRPLARAAFARQRQRLAATAQECSMAAIRTSASAATSGRRPRATWCLRHCPAPIRGRRPASSGIAAGEAMARTGCSYTGGRRARVAEGRLLHAFDGTSTPVRFRQPRVSWPRAGGRTSLPAVTRRTP